MTKTVSTVTDKGQGWLQTEKAALEDNRRKHLEQKGLKPFLTMEKGVTEITFDPAQPPVLQDGKYGPRKVFQVTVAMNEYQFGVNPDSPFYRAIIDALIAGHNILKVQRSGQAKDTRYEIL